MKYVYIIFISVVLSACSSTKPSKKPTADGYPRVDINTTKAVNIISKGI